MKLKNWDDRRQLVEQSDEGLSGLLTIRRAVVVIRGQITTRPVHQRQEQILRETCALDDQVRQNINSHHRKMESCPCNLEWKVTAQVPPRNVSTASKNKVQPGRTERRQRCRQQPLNNNRRRLGSNLYEERCPTCVERLVFNNKVETDWQSHWAEKWWLVPDNVGDFKYCALNQ